MKFSTLQTISKVYPGVAEILSFDVCVQYIELMEWCGERGMATTNKAVKVWPLQRKVVKKLCPLSTALARHRSKADNCNECFVLQDGDTLFLLINIGFGLGLRGMGGWIRSDHVGEAVDTFVGAGFAADHSVVLDKIV
ncbi:hypothetical protein CPC08DRAFT_729314 [Agrocybe pediades]|nr:hypothetical protein CPC08DRAFT_729314 [Agrocybe pediades]